MKYQAYLGLFVWLLTSAAIAHPGGLDANGGHTDKTTGEYHYHKKSGTNAAPALAGTKPAQPKSEATTKPTTNSPPPQPASATTAPPHDSVRLVANLIDPAKLTTLSPREAYPLAQKVVALLKQASASGLSVPEVVSNAVVVAGYTNVNLATMTRDVLVRNFEIAGEYGVFTAEGLREMQQGQSPQIQAGSFSGDAMTVDHIVPIAAAPELGNVMANLEFLPLEVKSTKGDSIGERQRDMARKFHAAGLITQERLQEILLR